MTIYIAASWKHQHGVEMLTSLLRENGHTVLSWVENNYGEKHNHVTKSQPFDDWCNSNESNQSFAFDTNGAQTCDLLVYYGPSGKDAAAECGMAYSLGKPMIAISAKGEDFGLMRKMFSHWFERYIDVVDYIKWLQIARPMPS